MLIDQFRVICMERRISTIWLEVRSKNRAAIAFYESHGFHKKGVRPNFYSNPTEDADLMAITLS
jgi:ribosomal-protein-alanine N-acetyltransferase